MVRAKLAVEAKVEGLKEGVGVERARAVDGELPIATAIGNEIGGEGVGADVLAEETTLLEGIMGGVVVPKGVMGWSGSSSQWRLKSKVSRRRPAWRGRGSKRRTCGGRLSCCYHHRHCHCGR